MNYPFSLSPPLAGFGGAVATLHDGWVIGLLHIRDDPARMAGCGKYVAVGAKAVFGVNAAHFKAMLTGRSPDWMRQD
jgi:hypothetical protein